MTRFDASEVMAGLKSFQRATVEHVTERLYRSDPPARRYLVADETGLGKSLVARGVIARAIEHLQHDDSCPRIDIVYVCSNADIADQNIKRLDVLDQDKDRTHRASRLTLLAKNHKELNGPPDPRVGKRVNLISFTPGTSFDLGFSTGRAEERALLHYVLSTALKFERRTELRAAALVLSGSSRLDRFEEEIGRTAWALSESPPDPTIVRPFLRDIRASGLLRRFNRAVLELGRRRTRSDSERRSHDVLVGALRNALAHSGVEALQPDLVILDEFQRFRHLLAVDDPQYEEAARLAEVLFDYGQAKVLLLSATPYKPLTYAEEAAAGDDHVADLRRTLGFLAGPEGGEQVSRIVDELVAYRAAAIRGERTDDTRSSLEKLLTKLMCRTERRRIEDQDMLLEKEADADQVLVHDIVGFAALRHLAKLLDAPVEVDYWKSTPYFVNFLDGYKIGDRLREALREPAPSPELAPMVRRTQRLDGQAVRDLAPLDPGNARLRRLTENTVGAGWWRLLWLPASAPYEPPGGPFGEQGAKDATKRLVFSSWTATPTAIACLLSHDVNRRIAQSRDHLQSVATRLDWRMEQGRPGAMTTLALFLPVPDLASNLQPFGEAQPIPLGTGRAAGSEAQYWTAVFSRVPGSLGYITSDDAAAALGGDTTEEGTDVSNRLRAHVDQAFQLLDGRRTLDLEERRSGADDLEAVLAAVGRYAPGNIAFRCVRRLCAGTSVSRTAIWKAAAVIASGLRSMFNRPESILVLDQVSEQYLPHRPVYWRMILQYCAWGNLEAVLDEYLQHLAEADRIAGLTDDRLNGVAARARDALALRPSIYEAFDPLNPDTPISFNCRFALRYGNKQARTDELARLPQVRNAFNSPFWPFVMATTSIGQEGIDLHWWCHSAVHWNTPASPVDFEQREGRIHRYGGHAIRRNIANRDPEVIRTAVLAGRNPWDAAYEEASSSSGDRYGDLYPYWIAPGPYRIERHLLPYPLSQDTPRYVRLKEDLAIYRLAFGQPRQEDLLDLLKQRGVHLRPDEIERLKLDLRPPTARQSD